MDVHNFIKYQMYRCSGKWEVKAGTKKLISGSEYSQLMAAWTKSAEWRAQAAKMDGIGMKKSFLSDYL